MRRIPLRALTALLLTAIGLAIAACDKDSFGAPSQQWDDQQRIERGHYG